MIISKKKYEEELEKAYARGRDETLERQNVSEANNAMFREIEGVRKMVYQLTDQVEAMKNNGKKPKFRCPHLGGMTFRGC